MSSSLLFAAVYALNHWLLLLISGFVFYKALREFKWRKYMISKVSVKGM